MRREPRCEFELAVQELAPAELGSGLWIGPMLPRHVGDVAPFHLHLSLLLPPGGGFWGVEGWEVEGCSGACPWLGERQGMIEGQVLGRGCTKVSGDGLMISSVPISPSVSDSSSSSSTSSSLGASPTC